MRVGLAVAVAGGGVGCVVGTRGMLAWRGCWRGEGRGTCHAASRHSLPSSLSPPTHTHTTTAVNQIEDGFAVPLKGVDKAVLEKVSSSRSVAHQCCAVWAGVVVFEGGGGTGPALPCLPPASASHARTHSHSTRHNTTTTQQQVVEFLKLYDAEAMTKIEKVRPPARLCLSLGAVNHSAGRPALCGCRGAASQPITSS